MPKIVKKNYIISKLNILFDKFQKIPKFTIFLSGFHIFGIFSFSSIVQFFINILALPFKILSLLIK